MGVFNQLISAVQAASSILGSSLARDVVRITDENGNQLFVGARIMRATVREESTFFEHPLEDGNKVIDQKIMKPVEIQLAVIMPGDAYGAAYTAIRNAYVQSTPLIVQTKTGSYPNQYLQSIPHEETPEAGDSVVIALNFREVQWYKADVQTLPAKEVAASKKSPAGVKSKPDASTVKRGQVKTAEVAPARKSSILFELKRDMQFREIKAELDKAAKAKAAGK